MERRITKISKPVLRLATLFTIFFGIYFLWLLAGSEFRGAPYFSDLLYLEKEFEKIPPPQGARRIGDISKSSKVIFHAVSADFEVSLPPESVVNYYQNSLLKLGWMQKRISNDISNPRKIIFCKSDMDAVLALISHSENSLRYYFGIHWEGGRLVKSGCGDSPRESN